MEIENNHARFLTLLHILVDETTEAEPLSRKQILERCGSAGVHLCDATFYSYLRGMAEGGIVIKHRYAPDVAGRPNVYWYADGWI